MNKPTNTILTTRLAIGLAFLFVVEPATADVPRALDQELATIERAMQGSMPGFSTAILRSTAERRNDYLLHSTQETPCYRVALAETLILIHDTLAERAARAPLGEGGQPEAEDLAWEADDPLAGDLESIAPFSMRDAWERIAAESPEDCTTTTAPRPGPTPPPPPPGRRTESTDPLRPEIHWSVERVAQPRVVDDPEAVPANASQLPYADDFVHLSIRTPPRERIVRQHWTVRDPNRRVVLDSESATPTFRVGREGTYAIDLEVETRSGPLRPGHEEIRTAGAPPERVEFEPEPTPTSPHPPRQPEPPRPRRTSEQCAECEVAGVRGYLDPSARYFYGACTTLHNTVCWGRYDCHTDVCSGWETQMNPVYTAAFNQGIDDVRDRRVCRDRLQRDRLYRLGVDHERLRQGILDQEVPFGECRGH